MESNDWHRKIAKANPLLVPPRVTIYGESDDFGITSRAELEDFITYLYGLANEAFGPDFSENDE